LPAEVPAPHRAICCAFHRELFSPKTENKLVRLFCARYSDKPPEKLNIALVFSRKLSDNVGIREFSQNPDERRAVNKLTTFFLFSAFSISLSAQITLGPTLTTFGILGGSTVTSSGFTVIGGNLGVSPGSAITGFPPGVVNGVIHGPDGVSGQAQIELTTAYNAAAGTPCTANLTGVDLGGQILTPGVYCFDTSAQLTGTLIFNGQGNQNSQFIFRIGSTLTTATGSNVVLTNLAQPANIFWQIGSSATLGTTSGFAGNILALTSISFGTNAVIQGRALARNGAVTLLGNTLILPVANAPPGTPGGPALPSAPAPTSLILVSIGLVCAGIYQSRHRLINQFRRN
jgi:Ice-binding-like